MSSEYLKISPNNKSVGLCINCSVCKSNPNNGNCKSKNKEDKNGKYCKYPSSHKYKLRFHQAGTNKRTKTKVLDTRIESEAIKIAFTEYKHLKEHGCLSHEQVTVEDDTPKSLFFWIEKFIDYKVNPPKNGYPISKITLNGYQLHLDELISGLLEQNINPKNIEAKDLTKSAVEYLFKHIKKRAKSGRTQEGYFKTYKQFWNYLTDEENLILQKNPFKGWRFVKPPLDNEIIYQDEFMGLLNNIDTMERFEIQNGKKRNKYFRWLKDAFKLGLYTGVRRQEVVIAKWSGVNLNRNTNELFGGILEIRDEKMSMKYHKDIFKYVSINEDLAELLIEMGYDQYKGQDKYIIDSAEEFKRSYIKDCLSKSFAYYIQNLGISRPLSFECLRKAYSTFSKQACGEDLSQLLTVHTNKEVMKNHYWNRYETTRIHEKFRRVFQKT